MRNYINCTPPYYRFWAVANAETGLCIGLVTYYEGHVRRKRVSVGYMIDPACQRQGIATEVVSAMLNVCFGELGLHRAQAFTHPDNTAWVVLVKKRRFCREGVLRDHLHA